jgi:acetyl esterase/lipase
MEWAKAYIGDSDLRTALASPLYADLSGFPPMLIQVGTAEILLDDAIRMADCVGKDGVEVTLDTAEGMCHVWHGFTSMLPEAIEAIEKVARFIRKHLRG